VEVRSRFARTQFWQIFALCTHAVLADFRGSSGLFIFLASPGRDAPETKGWDGYLLLLLFSTIFFIHRVSFVALVEV